ncbi:MAG: radical SAM protein [Leptospirales bacterium]
MKTLLIATHQISFSQPQSLYNCLGVLTLAACLKKRNLNCEVLDLFEYNDLYNRDCSEVLDSIAQKIIAAKPDILGFSAMINNLPIALELAARVKKIRPDVFTVFGGPGAAFCAKEVLLNFKQVDVIFRGEADVVFPGYIENLANNNNSNNSVPGLIFRNGAEIVDNGWPEPIANLDELPVPDYHFDSESYKSQTTKQFGDYNGVSIEVGRGCPYTCTFCSTSEYFKRKYRLKTVDRIIEEILLIHRRLGRARIIFNHDLLTLKRKFVFELCEQIEARVPGLIWKCHARLDTLDSEMLTKMNEAGCNEIFLGLENATEKMQKIVKKKLDLDKFDVPLESAASLDMKFSLSFIVGFPEEEEEDIRAIFAYSLKAKQMCREKVQIKIHTLAPLVGSALYEQWKDRLVYDAYGSISTTDIPHSWSSLRNTIQGHPEIFSIYFHLDIGQSRRINSSKYGYLGLIIEKLMIYSMSLAHEWLGDSIAEIFVNNIDEIILPQAASAKDSEYHALAQSVRKLLTKALQYDSVAQSMYDAVAQYEIAVLDIMSNRTNGYMKVIEVYYDPEELIERIHKWQTMKQVAENLNKRDEPLCLMILWDDKENKLKRTEISPDFAHLVS